MSANRSRGGLNGATLEREEDWVRHRANDLNREMMRLSEGDRRKRWLEYYKRLDEMMTTGR